MKAGGGRHKIEEEPGWAAAIAAELVELAKLVKPVESHLGPATPDKNKAAHCTK